MAAHSKDPREEEEGSPPEGVAEDDASSCGDDDGSASNSSSSSSSSSSSGSEGDEDDAPSSPERAASEDKIRREARELLERSTPPDDPGRRKRPTAPATDAGGYRSYQDAPPSAVSAPGLGSDRINATSNPPWAGDVRENALGSGQRQGEGGLSATDVATMAFGCLAHCLTESYRAASSYYGGHQHDRFPPASDMSSYNYQQVSGYSNADPASSNGGGGGYHNDTGNGYGGYQAKFSDNPAEREVMDRGVRQQQGSQSSGQRTEQRTLERVAEPQDEWATVQVPSTYQGGRVGV